jgi:hypothetical protein
MIEILVFATQFTLSLISFGLIALWVIYPRLRERSFRDALTSLLLFQTLRTIGLVVVVPTIVDVALPSGFAIPGAVGDMLAVVLAFVALVAVRSGWRAAPALVWLFTVEGLADFINAAVQGLRFGIPSYHLGIAWLVPTFGVPAFTVAQFMIVAVLLNAGRRKYAEAHIAQSQHIPDRLVAHIS